jgi:hypothetical protein
MEYGTTLKKDRNVSPIKMFNHTLPFKEYDFYDLKIEKSKREV